MSPEEELRFLILGAQREGNRILTERLAPLGLTPSQGEVVKCLSDSGPISLRALGQLLVCETGSPSRLVDSMVVIGVVARRENPADRRQVTLELIPLGQKLSGDILVIETQLYAFIAQLLGSTGIATAIEQLRILTNGTAAGNAIAGRKAQARAKAGASA